MDVGDFLSAFMHHVETVTPPPPLPDASAAAAERLVRDEGRRRWIASVTVDDIVSAGESFCRETIK